MPASPSLAEVSAGGMTQEQQALVETHMHLLEGAIGWAQKRRAWIIDRDEAIADAAVGLCDAARRFDPAQQVLFSTYAPYRTGGEVLDGERRYNRLGGRKRQQPQVVSQLNGTRARSLDALLAGSINFSLYDMIPDQATPVEEQATTEVERHDIYTMLGNFGTSRQVAVFYLRAQQETFTKIGEKLGFSESTVRRDFYQLAGNLRAQAELETFGIE